MPSCVAEPYPPEIACDQERYQVTIKLTAPSGYVDKYYLDCMDDYCPQSSAVLSVNSDLVSHIVTGLTPNREYHFEVRSYRLGKESNKRSVGCTTQEGRECPSGTNINYTTYVN